MSQSNETQSGTLETLLQKHKIATLYSVLAISADSSDAEIQSAIAPLKNSVHPLSAEQAYAIEILGKPDERRRYDSQLRNRLSANHPLGSPTPSSDGQERITNDLHSSATGSRYRFAFLMLCCALAGIGGWSYLNGVPQPLTKLARAAGINSSGTDQRYKCSPIKVKHYSEEQRQAAIARINDRGLEVTPEHMSVALSNLAEGKSDAYEMITDFLVAGIELNTPTQRYSDPIMLEILRHGNDPAAMLQLALEHGANINNPYQLPLVAAARVGNFELAKYLIDHCANANLRQAGIRPEGYVLAKGHTPLTAAVYGGGREKPIEARIALVRLMLDHGADVNQPGDLDMTPAHDASTSDLELLKLLVERGAKLENPWILFAAINFGREENAIYLIQSGANRTWKQSGHTLIDIAQAKGLSRVVRLLQEKGV